MPSMLTVMLSWLTFGLTWMQEIRYIYLYFRPKFGTVEPRVTPWIIRTFYLIQPIVIRTIVCFLIGSIDFYIWIIRTFCLLRTKFSRIILAILYFYNPPFQTDETPHQHKSQVTNNRPTSVHLGNQSIYELSGSFSSQ